MSSPIQSPTGNLGNPGVMQGSMPPPPMYADGDKAQATKLRDWQLRQMPWMHPYRLRLARGWRRADLFKQGLQWLRESYNMGGFSAGTMHYAPIEFDADDNDAIPTPVFDRFSPPMDNEASRLGKPEYQAYARYDEGADIKTRTRAKLSQEILQSELVRERWADTVERANLHMPLYGQMLLLSEWETDYEGALFVPNEGMLSCPDPECDFKTASPNITADMAGQLPTTAYSTAETDEGDQHTLTHCPQCESHMEMSPPGEPDPFTGLVPEPMPLEVAGGPALQPFEGDEQSATEFDNFGRPMGNEVPNGRWRLRLVSPFDMWPYNMGVDEDNQSLRAFTLCEVHPVPWFASHFENGGLVKRESPAEIMRYNPITGERSVFYGNNALVGTADGLFQNHCRLRSTYILPWREKVKDEDGNVVTGPDGEPVMRMNNGRCIKMAGDVLLVDGDFYLESIRNPGNRFARAHLENVVWTERSGGREYFGDSLSNRLFDPQENINEIISQIQDARQAAGSPKWLVPRGMNFDYNNTAEAGAQWLYDPDLDNANLRPMEVGNTLLNAEVYKELEVSFDLIDFASNQSQVEQGNVPPGVAAALAIQMLAEQTNEQRRPRIRRIREALERLWSHGMLLNHEMVMDTRQFWKDADGPGEWSQDTWTGEDLYGVTEIKIKAEPEHDTAIQKQQLVRDMIDAGLFDLNDPRVRRTVAREMGGTSEYFEQQDRQEQNAEIEYVEYRDGGRAPVVEEEIDDDAEHYDRHTFDVKSEWCRDLEKKARWYEALPYMTGWNDPGPPVPAMDPATGLQATDPTTGQPAMQPGPSPFDMAMQLAQGTLPNCYEIQVVWCWRMMLLRANWQPQSPEEAQALEWLMRFRAHITSHRRNATKDAMAAQSGLPVMQPGGAPSAPGGTIGPGTVGQPVAQAGPRQVQIPGSTMPVPATPAGAPPA